MQSPLKLTPNVDADRAFNDCQTLPQIFEYQVDRSPDQIAVEFQSRQLTYRELDDTANQLAQHLHDLDVGPEITVAFWLPRSLDVYVALLGILKSGGAYVPIDADYPADRVAYILENSASRILITTAEFASRLTGFAGTILLIDAGWPTMTGPATRRLTSSDVDIQPQNLCYIIYTSGSTGKPKGVEIEHRSAVHLVKTEAARFAIRPEDRVYQGFSIAFDASVEELWLAWCAGATLVAATPEMIHAGPDLPAILNELQITVISCVPTLLAMMEGTLNQVRILIVGGEACSTDLVARWCVPGRRMFNTYGPTEATVIATWTECQLGKPITIGEPLPGYTAFVLNDSQQPLGVGETGELYLGGQGLARGYAGRPDLTQERFIQWKSESRGTQPQRLYRTGDLVRGTQDGQLEFLGRADGQVKLRGFRVELSEIESELMKCPGVRAAAVTVREDVPGVQQLVGYLVPRTGFQIAEDQIRSALRDSLPPYMIPTLLETIESLPTLTSGKVDRKQLPAPRTIPHPKPPVDSSSTDWAPQDPFEVQLKSAWDAVFSPAQPGPHDDFFLDMGGHSLLAARMVSLLRKSPELAHVSMLEVYQNPTIARLAVALRERFSHAGSNPNPAESKTVREVHRVTPRQHTRAAVTQFLCLYFIIGFFSLQWLAPYLTYSFLLDDGFSGLDSAALSLMTLVLLYPVMLVLSIAVKWVVIGRIKPGRYPLWGSYFLRWWFVQSFRNIVPISYLTGTPLINLYYRLMGARIGANVYVGNDGCQAFDLLSIGDDSCLGADSHFTGATVEDGWLILGRVDVGRRCFVGTRTVLGPGSMMDDDSELDDLSLLAPGMRIPQGEVWRGSPAQRVRSGLNSEKPCSITRPTWLTRFGYGVIFVLGTLIVPLLPMAAFFPGMIAMAHLNTIDQYYFYLILSPLVATSFVVLISLEIAAVKWLVLGRVRPGEYPVYSPFSVRKWFVDRLLHLSLDVIGPLYSTLYLAPWYRLLGARIGHRTEVSTASFVSPDCLEIGDESFVADAVSLGAARVKRGVMTINQTRIGRRSFVGNSALAPIGANIPDNCLIGCLSTTPEQTMPAGSSWLGSPSFFLPQRQESSGFTEEETFSPSRSLIAQRLVIEFFRITMPSTLFIISTNLLLSAILLMRDVMSVWQIVLMFPMMYALSGSAAALTLVAIKWILMGRYRPCERPLWSHFVWRTELVTSLLDNFASPFFLDLLAGTPFICLFFRLLGAKIGKRVYLDTTEMTEFDLIRIGDDVAINLDCTLQTHLFEDRVMKMSTVEVGDGCHLGAMSLILYDTQLGDGVSIGDLSLVMKGESLPAQSSWIGIPGRKVHSP